MLESFSLLKGFYSWLFFNFSASKLHPAVFMSVISALDEKPEMDKVIELPSVGVVGYTQDWIYSGSQDGFIIHVQYDGRNFSQEELQR